MMLFYGFWTTPFFKNQISPPIVNGNAWVAGAILNASGHQVNIFGDIISSNQFSISVKRGCDALEPIALLVTAIGSFPVSVIYRLQGVLIGSVLLLVLNQLRIISLYFIGIHYPDLFTMMHVDVWQSVFIIVAVALWISWMEWVINIQSHHNNQNRILLKNPHVGQIKKELEQPDN